MLDPSQAAGPEPLPHHLIREDDDQVWCVCIEGERQSGVQRE